MQDRAPAFTPFLGSNQAPQIEGADAALRERLPAIPFDRYRKPEDRDPDLVAKIVAEEASGVLNYVLAGYTDAITNPMVIRDLPEECVRAAAETFQDMDVYSRWRADDTEPTDDRDQWITAGEAWDAFVAWGGKTRELMKDPTITRWRFGKALTDAGHPREKARRDGVPVNVVRGLTWSAELKAEAARIAAEARRRRGDEAARHRGWGANVPRSGTTEDIAALAAERVPESTT